MPIGIYKRTEEHKRNQRIAGCAAWRSDGRKKQSRQPLSGLNLDILHRHVEEQRGKPKFCEVCGTEDAKLYDWASPDHTRKSYEDIDSYLRMCRKCHSWFDRSAGPLLTEAREEIEELRAEIEQLKRGE